MVPSATCCHIQLLLCLTQLCAILHLTVPLRGQIWVQMWQHVHKQGAPARIGWKKTKTKYYVLIALMSPSFHSVVPLLDSDPSSLSEVTPARWVNNSWGNQVLHHQPQAEMSWSATNILASLFSEDVVFSHNCCLSLCPILSGVSAFFRTNKPSLMFPPAAGKLLYCLAGVHGNRARARQPGASICAGKQQTGFSWFIHHLLSATEQRTKVKSLFIWF